MGPTLKSILYKGHFSMYLDIILVPYFRLSSIFFVFSLVYTFLYFHKVQLSTDYSTTDADYAYGAYFDVFTGSFDYAILLLHSFTFFS